MAKLPRMCVHIRHSLAIPPIPPTRVRKNAGLPRLYPQKEIRASMYCVATRHVPTLNPAVGGYRFDAVDAVRPQEWSDDRLRSVKRVGKPREGSLDPLREIAEKPEESQGALSDCNWTAERKAKGKPNEAWHYRATDYSTSWSASYFKATINGTP